MACTVPWPKAGQRLIAAVGRKAVGAEQQRDVVVRHGAVDRENYRHFREEGFGLVLGKPVAGLEGDAVVAFFQRLALLQLLMERSGEVLSRTQIASQVWQMNFDSDTNVVDVAIRRLRAKVDDPFTPKLIHTVRGMGYTLEMPE